MNKNKCIPLLSESDGVGPSHGGGGALRLVLLREDSVEEIRLS